ncbi:MAG: PAS domain S-box protein, partial [Desulfamplus sp.]|nr:PAS domain S-box protein [Desulfamplus sp.]
MTEKPTYEELEQRIKELELAEINLKRNEALFRGLFDNMTSGSAVYEVINDGLKGSDYIVKGFNNKSLEIEGKKLEDVLGKTLFDLRPNIDDYGLISVMKKVWETGLSAYHPVKLYKDNNFSNYYENYIFKIPSGEIVTIYNDITVQKNQEIALQESKERFELAMQFTNDGLFDWNLETNEIHYSSGWKRMLGYNDDEIKDEFSEWERLTKFEDMKTSWDMMNELLEGKRESFEKEFKMRHKDGHWVDILSRANVVFNKDGKGVRVVGTHVDITKRKLMEHSLYESETRFKALHNASFGGIGIHDKGIILECNQGLSEMTGYSMTELIGMNGLLLIAEKSRNLVMQNILSGYEKPYEAIGLRKNGEEYPMRLEARNIPYKGKDVRVVEFRDITEQKVAESALSRSEEKFRRLAEEIPAYICSFLLDGTFIYVNPAVISITGMTLEEIFCHKVFDFINPDEVEVVKTKMELLTPDDPIEIHEQIYTNPEGIKQYHEWRNRAFFDENGAIDYLLGIGVDITARKQAEINEKELEAANLRLKKAESLSQMAGGIAHLFNNYLYAVSGNLELALEYLPNDALIHKYLIQAMKAANRCADVSGSMLTYLGQNFVKTESIDISKFCQTHLPILQPLFNNNITIDTKLSDSELIVRANAGQMQQILNHLITNACESIGEKKGRINLTTKTMPASDISKFHLLPFDS